MTIAIKRQNGDIIWFDAIEGFSEVLSTVVTKHPIATGAYVADHIINDNKRFTLRGVLSDADFNLSRPKTLAEREAFTFDTGNHVSVDENGLYKPRATNKQYINDTPVNTPVTINSNKNMLSDYLPESLSQFTNTQIPEVIVERQSKVKSASAVRIELIRMRADKETFAVLDFEDNLIRRTWYPCVLTNLSFDETPEQGHSGALFPVMEIEEVVFTNIEKVNIAIRKVANKGRQQGQNTKKVQTEDPKNGPTTLSKQGSEALKGTQISNGTTR